MLVGPATTFRADVLLNAIQLNTQDQPIDMTFKLQESPWIRAGRQYSVRVCCDAVSILPVWF